MTKLTPRLKLAILRSKLPDKALISAVENAEKTAAAPAPAPTEEKPKRGRYARRDMRAEE